MFPPDVQSTDGPDHKVVARDDALWSKFLSDRSIVHDTLRSQSIRDWAQSWKVRGGGGGAGLWFEHSRVIRRVF
jgi:hypothetical protein